MNTRELASDLVIDAFCSAHAGWRRDGKALVKRFAFDDYAGAVGFVVRVALAAERRDHHPDIALAYRGVEVAWSTHDAGGISGLDVAMAELTDRTFEG